MMKIEYKKPFTLSMVQSMQDQDAPMLEALVESIDGVPLADCDGEAQLKAGFAVMAFFMESGIVNSASNTNTAGNSSKS